MKAKFDLIELQAKHLPRLLWRDILKPSEGGEEPSQADQDALNAYFSHMRVTFSWLYRWYRFKGNGRVRSARLAWRQHRSEFSSVLISHCSREMDVQP